MALWAELTAGRRVFGALADLPHAGPFARGPLRTVGLRFRTIALGEVHAAPWDLVAFTGRSLPSGLVARWRTSDQKLDVQAQLAAAAYHLRIA